MNEQTASFFCLGTFVCRDGEIEPSNGRLLIFTAKPTSSSLLLSLVAEVETKGCVYALAIVNGMNGMIAAAVNSAVRFLRCLSSLFALVIPLYR